MRIRAMVVLRTQLFHVHLSKTFWIIVVNPGRYQKLACINEFDEVILMIQYICWTRVNIYAHIYICTYICMYVYLYLVVGVLIVEEEKRSLFKQVFYVDYQSTAGNNPSIRDEWVQCVYMWNQFVRCPNYSTAIFWPCPIWIAKERLSNPRNIIWQNKRIVVIDSTPCVSAPVVEHGEKYGSQLAAPRQVMERNRKGLKRRGKMERGR